MGEVRLSSANQKLTLNAVLLSISSGAYYGLNTAITCGIARPIVFCNFFPTRNDAGALVNHDTKSKALAQGFIVGAILVGASIGSFMGMPLAEKLGRRRAFQFFSVWGLSVLLLPFLNSFSALLFFRVVVGIPIGACCSLAPLYVTECVPDRIRGSVGTLLVVSITGAMALAQLLNFVMFPEYDPNSDDQAKFCVPDHIWRVQLGLGAIPSLVLLLHSFTFLPESPRWESALCITGGFRNQSPMLMGGSPFLAPSPASEAGRFVTIHTDRILDTSPLLRSQDVQEEEISWANFFMSWHAIIGLMLSISTMLTGFDGVMLFGILILKESGLQQLTLWNFIIVGLWNWICVFVATFLVDRLGTRPLMVGALATMTLCCATMSLTNFLLGEGPLRSFFGIGGILLYILAFESGPGPLFFLLASEIFPGHVRPKALVFTNLTQWLCNFITVFSFPFLITALGFAKTFLLLAIISGCCTAFLAQFLVETRGLA